ncbi:hypothetical protein ACFQPA_13075 [Halomarina halobia]|uniref:LppX_LprAFG lipoprotein n=1 Tax=Halomarina halobia TaxID=3033386 RepID=A0ABD6A8V5_9EURY|nr:hypothetical protein [Halomarina sp. PSR21]
MTKTKFLLTLTLALLVTTAGCSGLLGDGPEGSAPATGDGATNGSTPDNATNDTEEPSATEVDAASALPSDLAAVHERSLRAAGSFSARQEITIASTDPTVEPSEFNASVGYRIDLGADRARSWSAFALSIDTYTEGETTYEQSKFDPNATDENATYTVASANDSSSFVPDPVNVTEAMGLPLTEVGNVSYERAGTDRFDGAAVTRYVADGPEAYHGLPTHTSDNATLAAFSATLLVDDSGIVRLNEWSATLVDAEGAEVSFAYRHAITDVGETRVERPPWLEYARERGSR